MKAYRDTLLFLEQEGASDSHGNEHLTGAESEGSEDGKSAVLGKARIGDLVEVEIAGTLVTATPVRVRAVTEDDWVFVDGSETGIEMENITVVERPNAASEARVPPTLPLENSKPPASNVPSGYRSETFDADEGEVRITWPSNLSSQSVADMEDWLELLKRRIARRAGGPGAEE